MENKTQQLLEEIETYLKSKGFKQEEIEQSPVFKLQRKAKRPGPTMVVNGKQVQAPAQELIHTVKVEFFGPGDVDEKDRFEIIRFYVEDLMDGGKSIEEFEHMEGFYPGELDRFKQMLDKLGI